MPQRFLRPGITDSVGWNACCWQTQTFYIRLITLVDDFGRYDANPKLLRGHAFALREDVTSERVTEMCKELQKFKLADFYQDVDKQYLQILKWQENPRAKKSKCPDKTEICTQMFSNVSKCSVPSSSSSSSSSPSPLRLSPMGVRMCKWFKRRESTVWDIKEIRKLQEIEQRKDASADIDLLERYYLSDAKYKRQDILTLLNNWTGEIDRARKWASEVNGSDSNSTAAPHPNTIAYRKANPIS